METDEEQAIIKETEAFAEVWSEGDAKAAASFYTEDGVRVGAFGDVQHGQAEIEAAYDRLLHHTMPGAKVKQERGSVRMPSPELAVWQGGIEIIPPGGGPSLKGHVVQVMKKVKGRWLILEGHPKIFPPPPTR
ncbi:MAG: SgcJ/EcaC family oxidoreductase [Chloroflexi bacterium]|nr:SgcJ/EcaC family oxidoreductase [Chloroflexota bacterium]